MIIHCNEPSNSQVIKKVISFLKSNQNSRKLVKTGAFRNIYFKDKIHFKLMNFMTNH